MASLDLDGEGFMFLGKNQALPSGAVGGHGQAKCRQTELLVSFLQFCLHPSSGFVQLADLGTYPF